MSFIYELSRHYFTVISDHVSRVYLLADPIPLSLLTLLVLYPWADPYYSVIGDPVSPIFDRPHLPVIIDPVCPICFGRP